MQVNEGACFIMVYSKVFEVKESGKLLLNLEIWVGIKENFGKK